MLSPREDMRLITQQIWSDYGRARFHELVDHVGAERLPTLSTELRTRPSSSESTPPRWPPAADAPRWPICTLRDAETGRIA